jgi:hypothetical protein
LDTGALAAYSGTYASEELDTSYDVFYSEGAASLALRGRAGVFPLTAIRKDAFALPNMCAIDFLREPDEAVSAMAFSCSRLADLRLPRSRTRR